MLVIGNKKCRNLQEQVGWNDERINKILEFLDGADLSDNVVAVSDISQILTPEELEVVGKAVSFIIYDGSLYIKKSESATEAKFDIIFTISGSTVISLTSKEITVTLSNGALGLATSTYSVYSKMQVDTLIGAKADTSYVDAQLALKANLAGANFTGPVSAKTLKQNEANYSYTPNVSTSTGLTLENIYNRFIEINNILYIILNAKITNNTGADVTISPTTYLLLSTPSIDSAIAAKIFDLGGKTVAEAADVQNTIIACVPTYASNKIDFGNTGTLYPCKMNFVNRDSVNNCRISVSSESSITIPAGESIYVFGRMFLSLI